MSPRSDTRAAAAASRAQRNDRAAGTERLLSVREVAERFFVTAAAVYKWIERGKLEALRTPGGGILGIPESTVLQFETSKDLPALVPDKAMTVMPETSFGVIEHTDVTPASAAVIENIRAGRYHRVPRRQYDPERALLLAQMGSTEGGWENEERFESEYPEGFARRGSFKR